MNAKINTFLDKTNESLDAYKHKQEQEKNRIPLSDKAQFEQEYYKLGKRICSFANALPRKTALGFAGGVIGSLALAYYGYKEDAHLLKACTTKKQEDILLKKRAFNNLENMRVGGYLGSCIGGIPGIITWTLVDKTLYKNLPIFLKDSIIQENNSQEK